MNGKELIQQHHVVNLYHRAFKEFAGRALWNVRQLENLLHEDALRRYSWV